MNGPRLPEEGSVRRTKGVLKSILQVPGKCLVAFFYGYRLLISPLFPPSCRFVPTCSEYAIDAVRQHGAVRGGVMALWRILRCHPFSRGGYDPVK